MADSRTPNGPLRERPNMARVDVVPPPPPGNPAQIIDQWGRALYADAFAPPRDPLAGVERGDVAGVVYRDIPIVAVSTGTWSIDGIRGALADHMIGQFNRPAQLVDDMAGDDRVQATLGSRTGGLFSQKLIHRAGHPTPTARECRRAWQKNWQRICPQSIMSELMSWAVMMGFAAAQIVWDTTAEPWVPMLRPWHPMFIYYRWDVRKYVALSADGPITIEPGDGKWFLFTPHGPYRGWVRGSMRAIAEKWFIKGLAWRDWARFNERHGLPIIKASVPAAGDPAQKSAFVSSLRTLGQQAVIGLPQNVDGTGYGVDLMEARDRAWETFGHTVGQCDLAIILTILWQNLTTQVAEGSLAAARVHGDVRQNAIEFDNQTLTEAIYSQLARPFAAFNFSSPEDATRSTWDVTPPEDFESKARTLSHAGQGVNQLRLAGWKVENLRAMARTLGLDLGALEEVAPVQIEARLATADAPAVETEEPKR